MQRQVHAGGEIRERRAGGCECHDLRRAFERTRQPGVAAPAIEAGEPDQRCAGRGRRAANDFQTMEKPPRSAPRMAMAAVAAINDQIVRSRLRASAPAPPSCGFAAIAG